MDKLEKLKNEMLYAKEAYEAFKIKNSRELTPEEKENNSQNPQFGVMQQSETRVFELTRDQLYEMRKLEKKMNDTHSEYYKELMKSKQKIGS
jgi:hypothetical protein